jgi:succinyl-CoA synthetase alpha subunit
MGYAGAIIERGMGTFAGKVQALNAAGVKVASLSLEIPTLVKEALANHSEKGEEKFA